MKAAADFRAALRMFLRRTEQAAAANDLTPQRYDLLLQIAACTASANGGPTMTELAERLSLGQTSVTELVKRAEASGLVSRRRDRVDRRVWRLRLTSRGSRRLSTAFEALHDDRLELLESFARAGKHLRAEAAGESNRSNS